MVTVMVTDPDTKVETINERQSIISGLVVTTSRTTVVLVCSNAGRACGRIELEELK